MLKRRPKLGKLALLVYETRDDVLMADLSFAGCPDCCEGRASPAA